jgi:hypothetical protein
MGTMSGQWFSCLDSCCLSLVFPYNVFYVPSCFIIYVARCYEQLEGNPISCKVIGVQLDLNGFLNIVLSVDCCSCQYHGVLAVYSVLCLVAVLCHCQLIWLVVSHVLHVRCAFSVWHTWSVQPASSHVIKEYMPGTYRPRSSFTGLKSGCSLLLGCV